MALIRYFKMNDNAATKVVGDDTGTADAASSANTEDMTALGMKGSALVFDGADTKIDCGSDFIGTTALTICAWIYPTDWGENDFGRIVDNTDTGADGTSFWLTTTTDSLRFTSDGGDTNISSGTDSVVLNTWMQAAVTRTITGVTNFCVNGVLSGTANQDSGPPEAGTGNVIIGNRNVTARTFDGRLHEMRFYDEVLTAAQIYDLYLADVTKFETNPIVINAFGNDIIISNTPVTVTSITLQSASAGDDAIFIDKNGTEVVHLANNYGDGTKNGFAEWKPPKGKPFTFQNGLKFDDSASALSDGDSVFVYLR